MRHECAWCGIETAPPDGKDDHLTTHGICEDCRRIVMMEMESEFLREVGPLAGDLKLEI